MSKIREAHDLITYLENSVVVERAKELYPTVLHHLFNSMYYFIFSLNIFDADILERILSPWK